jgi:hypothetical protein
MDELEWLDWEFISDDDLTAMADYEIPETYEDYDD